MYHFTMTTKEEDSVPGGLGYWVGSLASAFRKGVADELEPFGISPTQWAILEACYGGKANTPSGLARIIPIDTAAISRQLDKLKDKGLIQRRRSARDRRSIRVSLTAAGRELFPRLLPCVQANNAKFLKGITEAEQAAFINTIGKMLSNAETDIYLDEELLSPLKTI